MSDVRHGTPAHRLRAVQRAVFARLSSTGTYEARPRWRPIASGLGQLLLVVLGLYAVLWPSGGVIAATPSPAPGATVVMPVAAPFIAAPSSSVGHALATGPHAIGQAPPLPILPPSPINPELLKEIFLKLARAVLADVAAALRVPLDAWLASPMNFVSQTPPLGSYDSPVVTGLWGTVRAAANALLVLIFVASGLNVMLKDRIGAPYHEAAEIFPRAVVGATLANVSLWLAQLAIDFNNALCGLIGGTSLPGWQNAGAGEQTFATLVAGLLYLVVALFLILQMLMRLALIDVLIVVAPLALLCWTLPQTHGWARRWSAAFSGAVFTQFLQIVALKLGGELFTDLTPAADSGAALLPSLLGIAVLVLTIRLPSLLGLRGGGGGSGGVLRYVAYQQLRGK
jgi:hypothetical protein